MRDSSNNYTEGMKASIIELGADLVSVADAEPLKSNKGSSGQEIQ